MDFPNDIRPPASDFTAGFVIAAAIAMAIGGIIWLCTH